MSKSLIGTILTKLPSNNRLERIWKIAQVDFQTRYYNDRLGLLWALIKPLFEATLYFVVFTYFFEIQLENYAIYLFGGIIMWMVFAEASSSSMHLLQSKMYLIDNIQFNHIDIHLARVFSVFFGFTFNLAAFILISLIFGSSMSFALLYAIVVILTLYMLCLAASLILSSLQPFLKDLTHLWDMVLMTGFWTSGILYDSQIIFDKAIWYAYINPMVGTILNGRACSLGNIDINFFWLFYDLAYSIVALILGVYIFKKIGAIAVEKI